MCFVFYLYIIRRAIKGYFERMEDEKWFLTGLIF